MADSNLPQTTLSPNGGAPCEAAPDVMTVRYWYVCNDVKQSGGGTVFSEPLSPLFDAPEKAEAVLDGTKEHHRDAYICEAGRFFNSGRHGDAEARAGLISRLQ